MNSHLSGAEQVSDISDYGDARLKKRMRQEAGFYVRALRERMGLSQVELSMRLGLSFNSFVSQVETGRSRIPTSSMPEWAAALEVDEREFARNMLRYYEPALYEVIYGDNKNP